MFFSIVIFFGNYKVYLLTYLLTLPFSILTYLLHGLTCIVPCPRVADVFQFLVLCEILNITSDNLCCWIKTMFIITLFIITICYFVSSIKESLYMYMYIVYVHTCIYVHVINIITYCNHVTYMYTTLTLIAY